MSKEQVNEAILFAENDYPLMVHLDFDFYNTLAKKKMSGKYDRKLAIKLISEYFVPRIMHRYVNEIGEKYLYGMTKKEKDEIADYFLTSLETGEPICLDIVPLNYIKNGRVVKLMDVTDLSDYQNRERVKSYEPAKMKARKTTPRNKTLHGYYAALTGTDNKRKIKRGLKYANKAVNRKYKSML